MVMENVLDIVCYALILMFQLCTRFLVKSCLLLNLLSNLDMTE